MNAAMQLIRNQLKRQLSAHGYSVQRVDPLTALADKFGSDKGTMLCGHQYARIYGNLFEPLRQRDLVVLEMGLLRIDADWRRANNGAQGSTHSACARAPSLEMWSAYFPRARIYGFDIDDFSSVRLDRCTILRGDMSSRADLARLVDAIGAPIDIIIDDASHASHHQQIAFGHLFPHLRTGGLYVIEDLFFHDPAMELAGAPNTRDLLRRLQAVGKFRSPFLSELQQSFIEENHETVQLFDSRGKTSNVKDWTDSLAVVTKRTARNAAMGEG